ncbi:MAG: GHKL domain-containing protein [Bacilli bacterium]|nr:GHKL domain-containing protein [Bacilli bacterium]MDD4547302.1 GHKL domain-containing protein [Bacilli bacterium]
MIFLLSSFVVSLACFYVSSRIFKEKINFKELRFWLVVIINTILMTLLFIATKHYIRVLINYIVLVVLNKIYFKKKIVNVIIGSFFVFVLITVSEIMVAIILVTLLKIEPAELSEAFLGHFWLNLFIASMMIIFINIKKVVHFFGSVAENRKSQGVFEILPVLALIVLIYSVFFYYMYFKLDVLLAMILSVILIIIITFLVINISLEKNYHSNLKKEYNKLINDLTEYEKILEKYRRTNHENKNNFIVLKGMIPEKNKDIINHIDEIINLKEKDDDEILTKTKRLPSGGFQGLIYQKMLIMKEKGISCNLEISKDIYSNSYKKFDFELNKNLCAIAGIIIDNAIEAVEDLKTKAIGIYLYKDGKDFYFCISNNFQGPIDLERMDEEGYSSKGKGRGYGLSLVKRIVDKDERLSIEREFVRDIFKQKIKIKM